MAEERKEYTHESFGVLEISRVSGSKRRLFGSSVGHTQWLSLRISPAKLVRHLSQDLVYTAGIPYIEVDLSLTQLIEAIMSMNHDGVPVTVRAVGGKQMSEVPYTNKRAEIMREFYEKMEGVSGRMTRAVEVLEGLMKEKTVTKQKLKEVLHELRIARMEVENNVPFMAAQFDEAIEKTIAQAKDEINAVLMQWKLKSRDGEGHQVVMLEDEAIEQAIAKAKEEG